jgi:hypothetical protein
MDSVAWVVFTRVSNKGWRMDFLRAYLLNMNGTPLEQRMFTFCLEPSDIFNGWQGAIATGVWLIALRPM